ncbi:MAG TPA: 50S ribosomal protein L20 [Candidatus Omnitrophota bacterium]|nr:50S ribosomal protein L20 [Candidatus Omnitrophota bacterium]HPD84577.1 50S ribosomal protein L20 [Candidatus Omnitrophota bacterium]HRZ03435.1 50S ribosomal protein L20 [Candidatus Omnitrophota bacterium]
MVRIKHAVSTKRRKKRVLKRAKGQYAQRSRRYQQAKRSVIHSMKFSYRDRKVRKRDFRHLWIARINAACRLTGIAYSRFISGLTKAKVVINRKMLADLAVNSPEAFNELVKIAKAHMPAAKAAA